MLRLPSIRRSALVSMLLMLCGVLPLTAAQGQSLQLLTETGPPFNFPGESGPEGFTVDIVHELLRRTKTTGTITFLPWARAYGMALTTPDTVLFTVSRTAEREDFFHWVGPIIILQWGLYACTNTRLHITSQDDARLLSGISAYRSDVREDYLRKQGFANLYLASSFENSVQMMLEGHVPAVIADEIGIYHTLIRLGVPLDSVKKVFTFNSFELYIAFSRKSDATIATAWQNAFKELLRDGTYEQIHSKWLPLTPLPDFDALLAIP